MHLLFSSVLASRGVPHAFTTRRGGCSRGVFASLNFGNPGDLPEHERDPLTNIAANIGSVLIAIHAAEREVVQVHQMHGGDVHRVHRGHPAHAGASDTRADAVITDDPRRVLGVRVADCAPVLLATEDGGIVAAVHAGWRGVIAGITPKAALMMREVGAGRLVAAVGPCLSAEHFEIGAEVAAEFEREFGRGTAHLRPGAPGKAMLDMKGAIAEQLRSAGVEEIEVLPHCTYADPDLFFSHRRDRGRTGRMMAMIGPAGS